MCRNPPTPVFLWSWSLIKDRHSTSQSHRLGINSATNRENLGYRINSECGCGHAFGTGFPWVFLSRGVLFHWKLIASLGWPQQFLPNDFIRGSSKNATKKKVSTNYELPSKCSSQKGILMNSSGFLVFGLFWNLIRQLI